METRKDRITLDETVSIINALNLKPRKNDICSNGFAIIFQFEDLQKAKKDSERIKNYLNEINRSEHHIEIRRIAGKGYYALDVNIF
jgi:hypothetical protein